ncbi:MAG: RnfH family protein [Saccharospirillaceae bacterium]|nr:RnfH family protein [Pseudomonadales bacterium]NRB80131.1 RnfH family protein [Saccharospirillaceae bacterium]
MKIEVAYATPEKQLIVEVEVQESSTVREAVINSKLDLKFESLDLKIVPVGIFGKKVLKPEEQLVKKGDRYELYRALLIDPKQARANRAAKAKK